MEFDFANNTVKQIINDQEYNIDMDISTIQGKNIRMRLSPYGWWTGHYIRMDNLKIEQHSSTPEVQQLYYNFDLDLTNQPNGQVHIYAKATNGEDESNTVTTTLTKIAPSTIEPTNFEVQFEYNENAFYTWETTENNSEAEGKYVLRDQNDLVIVDNIHPGSSSYTEESLENNQTLQRKICKIDQYGEACSNLITFTTPQEIPTYDIYETRQLRLTIYHNITSEIQNSDIISLTQNGEYVWINPESPGKTYVKVIT